MSKFKIGDKVRMKDGEEEYTVFTVNSFLKGLVGIKTDLGETFMIHESLLELTIPNKYAIGNHLGIYRGNDNLDIAVEEAKSLGGDEVFVYRLIPVRRIVKYVVINLEGDGE